MKTADLVLPLGLMVLATASCGRDDASGEGTNGRDTTSVATPAGDMGGMRIPEVGVAQADSSGVDAELAAHLRMMHGASGDSLRALVPTHRQMAANMLARMNREMSEMNMGADAGWTATADSVRQDLTQMPELSTEELTTTLPGHEARLTRLGQMHQSMMRNRSM